MSDGVKDYHDHVKKVAWIREKLRGAPAERLVRVHAELHWIAEEERMTREERDLVIGARDAVRKVLAELIDRRSTDSAFVDALVELGRET